VSLTWRTYRDAGSAPVPVVESYPALYKLSVVAAFSDRALDVPEHQGAVGARSGRQEGSGQHVDASWLADEPVILRMPDGDRRLAKPQKRRPVSVLDRPRKVGPRKVFSAGRTWAGDGQWHDLQATPLSRPGAFRVEPGHRGQAYTRVRGRDESLTFDYDPVTGGLLVWDEDGAPIPDTAAVTLHVREEKTHRREMSGIEDAVLNPLGGTVWARAERLPQRVEDVRTLPDFDPVAKWDALDQAHYDGRPIPYEGNLWKIQAGEDTDRQRVADAVRRTLPSGSIYRVQISTPDSPDTPTQVNLRVLDDVTGAIGAYSFAYLSSDYNGPVIEARRGDGGTYAVAYQDFTPTEVSGGTLEAWANQAYGDAYISTAYDQTGSGPNATQPTLASQPQIVDGGNLITENGNPAFHQRSSGALTIDFSNAIETYSAFTIGGYNDMSTEPALFEIGTADMSSARRTVHVTEGGVWEFIEQNFMSTRLEYTRPDADGIHAHSINHDTDALDVQYDNNPAGNVAVDGPGIGDRVWLLNDANDANYGGLMQEFILYDRSLSDYERNRLALTASQRHDVTFG